MSSLKDICHLVLTHLSKNNDMRITYTFIFLLTITLFSFPLKAEESIQLIPQPAELQMQSGTLILPGSVDISYSSALKRKQFC